MWESALHLVVKLRADVRSQQLNLDIGKLQVAITKPLRVEFVTRECDDPCIEKLPDWHTMICCSASRREMGNGDSYVQGAGDDTEYWSRGLTPEIFWEHEDELLTDETEEELQARIDRIVSTDIQGRTVVRLSEVRPGAASAPFYIGSQEALESEGAMTDFDAVVCSGTLKSHRGTNRENKGASPQTLELGCPPGKLGSKTLRDRLPMLKAFLGNVLSKKLSPRIAFVCPNGRDLSIGTALVFFCLHFDNKGISKKNILNKKGTD